MFVLNADTSSKLTTTSKIYNPSTRISGISFGEYGEGQSQCRHINYSLNRICSSGILRSQNEQGLVNLCRSNRSLSGGSNHRVAEEIRKAQPMCFVFNRAGLDVVSASRLIAQYLFRA